MNGCVVAYYDAARGHCYTDVYETSRGQAERLVPMVQGVLDQGDVGFGTLDAIVTTLGPGTFTGIRIGLSTAKAFGMALDIPIFGISTLQALALSSVGQMDGDFTVLVETKRQDFYAQIFSRNGVPLNEPMSVLADDLKIEGAVIGDAVERYAEAIGDNATIIQGCDVIQPEKVIKAFCDVDSRADIYTANLEPIYLRGADVSFPKNPPRKLA